jgi:hypothetical protein
MAQKKLMGRNTIPLVGVVGAGMKLSRRKYELGTFNH